MAITKEQARKVRQPVVTGDLALSVSLSASATTETKILSISAEKVSWQSDGTLAGNIEFSIDGVTFFGSTAFTAGVPGSYSTHLVRAIKITRTGGTGKLHVLAR
jgi:hypothetical protein